MTWVLKLVIFLVSLVTCANPLNVLQKSMDDSNGIRVFVSLSARMNLIWKVGVVQVDDDWLPVKIFLFNALTFYKSHFSFNKMLSLWNVLYPFLDQKQNKIVKYTIKVHWKCTRINGSHFDIDEKAIKLKFISRLHTRKCHTILFSRFSEFLFFFFCCNTWKTITKSFYCDVFPFHSEK